MTLRIPRTAQTAHAAMPTTTTTKIHHPISIPPCAVCSSSASGIAFGSCIRRCRIASADCPARGFCWTVCPSLRAVAVLSSVSATPAVGRWSPICCSNRRYFFTLRLSLSMSVRCVRSGVRWRLLLLSVLLCTTKALNSNGSSSSASAGNLFPNMPAWRLIRSRCTREPLAES